MRKFIKLGISAYINAIVTSDVSNQGKSDFVKLSLINEKLNQHHSKFNYLMVRDTTEKDIKDSGIQPDVPHF